MAHFPTCNTRYSGAARLCRTCGGPLPPASVPPPVAPPVVSDKVIRVCGGCGRIVPAKQASCESCRAAPITEVERRSPADGAAWTRVTFAHACAGCGERSPTAIDPDARARCVSCGHARELGAMFWRVLVAHAQRVADLALVAGSPLAHVGVDVAEIEADRTRSDDDLPEVLLAGPGHPPCASCRDLVDTAWSSARACACGLDMTVAIPKSVRVRHPTLVALLAAPHALGLHASHAGASAAAVALRCPTCAAPLEIAGEPGGTVTCKYCGGSSLVTRPLVAERRLAPVVWLLLRRSPTHRNAEHSF